MNKYKIKRVNIFRIRELINLVDEINLLNIQSLIELSCEEKKINLKSSVGILFINMCDNLVLHIESDNIQEQTKILDVIKKYFIV